MTHGKPIAPVSPGETPLRQADLPEWAARRKNNIRLGVMCGAIAVAVFLWTLWKIRIV